MAEPRLWQDRELAGGPGNAGGGGDTNSFFPPSLSVPYRPQANSVLSLGKRSAPHLNLHAFYYELCDLGCRFCSQTLFRTLLAVRIQWDQMRECT